MSSVRSLLAMAFLMVSACPLAAAEPPTLEGGKWIWLPLGPGETMMDYMGGPAFFRGRVTLPEDARVESAELIATADNLYALYLNGQGVGESTTDPNKWNTPRRFDVSGRLFPGANVLAVEGVNTARGPAALVVRLVVRLAGGGELVFGTDETWLCSLRELPEWNALQLNEQNWQPVAVVGEFGVTPWHKFPVRAALEPSFEPSGKIHELARATLQRERQAGAAPQAVVEMEPGAQFAYPAAIAYVSDDCSLYRPHVGTGTSYDSLTVTIFNPRKSRSFPEHDLPAPMKVGRKLQVIEPGRSAPRVLVDAGRGALGSPSVSFDGRSILLSMVRDGEPFFHISRVPAEGGEPQRLTDGPFHDVDPVELPDGRIAFTSTRCGTFEEYHNPPSRALFAMNADGGDIRPITSTFIFDNEPEVLADGRIVFIRSDNFFDRGKVETLLHAVHPDGTSGYTEFGLDLGPDYGGRLRAFYCGSPAPMPDGRLAFVSAPGITLGRLGAPAGRQQHLRLAAGDVAALPDGRLLATLPRPVPVEVMAGKEKRTVQEECYDRLVVVDPNALPATFTVIHDAQGEAIHSPVFLGPRKRPPQLAPKMDLGRADDARATGILYCQNARLTKNTTAGWPHVRAIRVLAGKGLTNRSSHSYIVHAGNETIELGTVPLAPDGSFAIEVPADTAIALQAVDAEGRSELNEMSWIYVRPGESRGCVGCHQPRQATPLCSATTMQAMRTRPLRLLGQGDPHRYRGNNPAVTGMMELQFDRFREVAGIDRHPESASPLATGADEVASLVAELRGDDGGRRISAAQRLAIFRDPAAAEALCGRLTDPLREVRVAAATALAACGTRAAVPPMLEALGDGDPSVALAAAMALENLTGYRPAFDPYAPPAEVDAQIAAWRQWFAATGWEAIERQLVARLAEGDRDVARRAAVALGHVGGDAARQALRAYVAAEHQVNPFPEWRKDGAHQGDGALFNSLSPVNPRTLQAAVRSLGYLRDAESVPLLAEIVAQHAVPATGNLFVAEAAVEALGRIGTPQAEAALVAAVPPLRPYPEFTYWYGDHPALMACHASPIHYFITETLDRMGSASAGEIVPHLIRSLPTDPDRALLLESDDCETLTGRVIRRSASEREVVETCLAVLGDPAARRSPEIEEALATHGAWAGHPDPQNRAAQVLSLVCRDPQYEPRLRAALDRYRAMPCNIPRLFDHGIPVVQQLPARHWVCFYLARALGNMADPRSADGLIAALAESPPEAAEGYPDPLAPGVLFLHNDLTPCWRSAVAWALGRVGDPRAVPLLIDVVSDLGNAPDTRYAAADALVRLADADTLAQLEPLALAYPEMAVRRLLLAACQQAASP